YRRRGLVGDSFARTSVGADRGGRCFVGTGTDDGSRWRINVLTLLRRGLTLRRFDGRCPASVARRPFVARHRILLPVLANGISRTRGRGNRLQASPINSSSAASSGRAAILKSRAPAACKGFATAADRQNWGRARAAGASAAAAVMKAAAVRGEK